MGAPYVRPYRVVEYTPSSVIFLLKQYELLKQLAEDGDPNASDIVMDIDNIMEGIKVTERQRLCIDLVWFKGYTYKDTAELLEITPQGVYFHLKLVKRKLFRYLEGKGKYDTIRRI